MFVAESPGEKEDEEGTPFVENAPAGAEFMRLLRIADLQRFNVYITNTIKCHPPGNRDPKPYELEACRNYLLQELAVVRPEFLVTVGAVSTKNILGDVDMETVHGIPFEHYIPEIDLKLLVIPVYHPSAALRSPEFSLKCVLDFAALGKIAKGLITPAHYKDPYEGREVYGVLDTPAQVWDTFGDHKLLAVDTETLDWRYTPYMLQASAQPGSGFVIYGTNKPALNAFHQIVARPDNVTVIHNSLFDLFPMEKMGVFPSNIRDTMVMAYILQSEPQGLKPLAFRFWGMKMKSYEDMVAYCSSVLAEAYLRLVGGAVWPDPEPVMKILPGGKIHTKHPWNITKVVKRIFTDFNKGKIGREDFWNRWHKLDLEESGREFVERVLGEMPEGNLSLIPREEAIFYAARDPDATLRVYPYLWNRIQQNDQEEVFEMDMGIIPMVKDMMGTGMLPDPLELKKLGHYFGERIAQLHQEIQELAGNPINPGSHVQVAELLFNKLKIPFKHKHNKVSTNDKVLARIVAKSPVIPKIREYRGLTKLKSTYTDKLHRFIRDDGRIHTKISTTRTATGRLASSKPNLMNQPTRSEDGKRIRKAFKAREGCSIVSNDLSQIEMRVLADESGDKGLIKIFTEGLDLHSITASNIFGRPVDQLDEMLHRYPAKRVGFGVVYGITAAGLQEQLLMIGLDPAHWTIARCQQLIDDWFKLYPDVLMYMEDLIAFALRHGYVKDMFGRRRYLPTIRSASKWTRLEAARQAGNAPIQSGAAGIFKLAMKKLKPIYTQFQKDGYVCHPLIPIHDDLVFEVQEEIVPLWIPICQDVMQHVVTLKVPILSEAKVGKNWGEQEKYKW